MFLLTLDSFESLGWSIEGATTFANGSCVAFEGSTALAEPRLSALKAALSAEGESDHVGIPDPTTQILHSRANLVESMYHQGVDTTSIVCGNDCDLCALLTRSATVGPEQYRRTRRGQNRKRASDECPAFILALVCIVNSCGNQPSRLVSAPFKSVSGRITY